MTSATTRQATAANINNNQQGQDLGFITYWGLSDCRILVDDLRALFQQEGLDEAAYFPPQIQSSNAYRKAIKEIIKRHKGLMARPIGETTDVIAWGIVRETKDKQKLKLDYTCNVQIHFSKKQETVNVKTEPGASSEAKQAAEDIKQEYFNLTQTFITWDVQRMLTRNLVEQLGAVSLRRGGGFYFLPPQHLPVVEAHKRIVEQIGSSEVGILTLKAGSGHNTDSIKRDTRRSLEDDLNTVMEELDSFKSKLPREDTLQRRVQEYQQIKSKVQMYADLLSIKADDLTSKLDEAGDVVKQMLGQVSNIKEQKATEEKAKRAARRRETRAAARAEKKAQQAEQATPEEKTKMLSDAKQEAAPAEAQHSMNELDRKMDMMQQLIAQKQEAQPVQQEAPKTMADIKASVRGRRKRRSRVASF